MKTALPSFAKINLGLKIGPARPDGFHELRTVYQTIAVHDLIRVEMQAGAGIEIRCDDERVPTDASNTCYKIAERVLNAAGICKGVMIEIDKRLPVQGGLGAASSNAIATMLGMERALGVVLDPANKVRIAAEESSAEHGVTLTVRQESHTPLVRFDESLRDRIAAVLAAAGSPPPVLPTGAGHDAGVLAARVPTAMLFVRNPTGISHSPAEHADLADCEAGARALAAVLQDLAGPAGFPSSARR